MSIVPRVVTDVVNNDLCIGCGLCVYKCPNKALGMTLNADGFYIAEKIDSCDDSGECIDVCPFNPFPNSKAATEDEIAKEFMDKDLERHPKVGNYVNIYAGYSVNHRLTSSSGGIATYVLGELLKRGIVDHVFSVNKSEQAGVHYQYSVSSTLEQLTVASKTRYFPVTLGNVMSEIHRLDGRVAIVGVACFVKAVRLAQMAEYDLKKKIPFIVGIICGGVKSSFYTEYLAGHTGVESNEVKNPNFRIKDVESSASDYAFGCTSAFDEEERRLKMRSVGDMWGTGLFKANACDFCDDVTTELADISLGDAWLEPYVNDGKGTNVVVTRTTLADKIISEGIACSDLVMEQLPMNRFLESQRGSFNHRHDGLPFRIEQRRKRMQAVPPKRYESNQPVFTIKLVQYFRMLSRKKSIEIWKENPNTRVFDMKMKPYLYLLSKLTSLNRRYINWINDHKI